MAASPPAAPQQAAPAPYDLSSQPQAVVPEETAAEESARKMAAETPAEPPQPEAVPAEPAAPAVTAESPTEAAPAAPKQPPVVFKSVDYQDKDESGTGLDQPAPGSRAPASFSSTTTSRLAR